LTCTLQFFNALSQHIIPGDLTSNAQDVSSGSVAAPHRQRQGSAVRAHRQGHLHGEFDATRFVESNGRGR
jgi:hypothetical protein